MRRPSELPAGLAGAPFSIQQGYTAGLTAKRMRARDLETPFRGIRLPVLEGPATTAMASALPTTTPRPQAARLLTLCGAYALRMHVESYFSGATAAQLYGIPLPRRLETDLRLHVSVPEMVREPRMKGVVGHQASGERPISIVDGLRALSAADAWCELGSQLSLDELIVAGDRLIGWPRPLTTLEEVDAAIARYGSRRGCRRIAAARPHLRERSASARETWTRLALLRAGYPEPELNGEIVLSSGRRTHGDFVFRRYRVVFEYDGEQHRLDDDQYWIDVGRLNDLASDGWLVVRIGKKHTTEEALALLDSALRSHGWRP